MITHESYVYYNSRMRTRSIQHLAQPLHGIQEDIALTDDRLVLRVLERRPVRLHDAVHLVDRAVQPARRDEPRQLAVRRKGRRCESGSGCEHGGEGGQRRGRAPVDEVDADAEGAREAVEREAPVGLEELAVREDAHLADVVARMRREYAVRF